MLIFWKFYCFALAKLTLYLRKRRRNEKDWRDFSHCFTIKLK